jgi:hypothetical protein
MVTSQSDIPVIPYNRCVAAPCLDFKETKLPPECGYSWSSLFSKAVPPNLLLPLNLAPAQVPVAQTSYPFLVSNIVLLNMMYSDRYCLGCYSGIRME